MSTPNDGGRAFPTNGIDGNGMFLRDYFAAKAMQGWLASYGDDIGHPAEDDCEQSVATLSYKLADAMLKARDAK